VFTTSALNNVEVGKRVTLTVQGELKNKGTTYTFTGSDELRVISKPSWQPDDIKNILKRIRRSIIQTIFHVIFFQSGKHNFAERATPPPQKINGRRPIRRSGS
jgi:hypothetical protein